MEMGGFGGGPTAAAAAVAAASGDIDDSNNDSDDDAIGHNAPLDVTDGAACSLARDNGTDDDAAAVAVTRPIMGA